MTIAIYFSDLRTKPSKLRKYTLEWRPQFTALEALTLAVGEEEARNIAYDLKLNKTELKVAWYNKETDAISEIGGVGRLDWNLADNILVTINYESNLTTQEQFDELERWTLENET
jgi:hypothetical protein